VRAKTAISQRSLANRSEGTGLLDQRIVRDRRLWPLVLLVLLVVTLGACGSNRDSAETDELDDPTPSVTPAETIPTVSVPTTCQGGGVVIVFVNPAVSPARTAEIGAALQALPGVESMVYVDQQQAYAEFQELYKDQPDKLAAVTPEVLPSSYRLTLGDDGQAQDIEIAATALDGVGEVIC